jgi:hypothetical protein
MLMINWNGTILGPGHVSQFVFIFLPGPWVFGVENETKEERSSCLFFLAYYWAFHHIPSKEEKCMRGGGGMVVCYKEGGAKKRTRSWGGLKASSKGVLKEAAEVCSWQTGTQCGKLRGARGLMVGVRQKTRWWWRGDWFLMAHVMYAPLHLFFFSLLIWLNEYSSFRY